MRKTCLHFFRKFARAAQLAALLVGVSLAPTLAEAESHSRPDRPIKVKDLRLPASVTKVGMGRSPITVAGSPVYDLSMSGSRSSNRSIASNSDASVYVCVPDIERDLSVKLDRGLKCQIIQDF